MMGLESGLDCLIGRYPSQRSDFLPVPGTVAKKTRKARDGNARHQGSQRKVIVFAALLAVMTVTSALLLALAPAPLAPGAASSLFAVGAPDSLDAIFQTATPVQQGRWKDIYVHHSLTPAGSAATLGESAGGLAD